MAHPSLCTSGPRIVQLARIRASALEDLLEEETYAWRRALEWDFLPTANLVRRYVELESLAGFALLEGERAVGYTYFVAEERKGLVGDLYVMQAFRHSGGEARLLAAALDALRANRQVRRIESQLMLLDDALDRPLPASEHLRRFERQLMVTEAAPARRLAPRAGTGVAFQLWDDRFQGEAAEVIAQAYRGHVDGEVNDQYRSAAGARRFLHNIIQYPGCGRFLPQASWVALERLGDRLCGLCLTSMVAGDVGHITQVCVVPEVRGRGVGYELLRRSLVSLGEAGARKISLTVTVVNRRAVALYEAMGFLPRRRFAALVWEGFRWEE
ncbi:MAG: GNAT family N-acetyltransferase [Bryobacterales bacterium]|nr:GNAT family N-acetyltransferase [Bryobacterales bacterium]